MSGQWWRSRQRAAGYFLYRKGERMEKEKEIKKELKEKKVDRRELARKVGVSYVYLNNMLNGFVPMKDNYEKAIREELELR